MPDAPTPADQHLTDAAPGGCARCDAYTTPVDVDGVQLVCTHHEDTCPSEDPSNYR